ncbi:MAG: tetratricopeptide repeat protein [Planctomycetes bacterium]|nr:tetratricopeptide repeat protein [Planctomycetota bacterium]
MSHTVDRFRDFMDEPEPAGRDAQEPRGEIGKYKIVREVGRGGMAIVYEALDPDLKRRVALKALKPGEASPTLISRLRREATLAARLHHPNIVAIHEVGLFQDDRGAETHFIAMDFVEGKTLAEIPRSVPLRERMRILQTVAQAVGYAHTQGVIHRDLKPQNVLVEQATGRVFLTDFGLAHAQEDHDLTRSGVVIGTPHYMAPEQVTGVRHKMGPWTDVWALGVMLYEALTGRKPFRGSDPMELYQRIFVDEPTPPRKLNPAVHPDLETVCLKALEKEKDRRYADAALLAAELQRYLSDEPILTRPVSWRLRIWRKVRRNSTIAALGALLAIVLVAAGIWGNVQSSGRNRAEEEASKTRKLAAAMERITQLLAELDRLMVEPDVSYEQIEPRATEILASVEAAMRHAPKQANLWTYKGKALRYLGQETLAEAVLDEAIRLDPRDGRPSLEKAMILLDRIQMLTIGHSPDDARERRREAAEEWMPLLLENLRRADPGLTEDEKLLVSAWSAWCNRHYEEAETQATERIRRGGAVESFYFVRALARTTAGKAVEADLDRAIERRPGLWQARFLRGCLGDDPQEKLADFSAVVRINPRCAQAYSNRAIQYAARRQFEDALADFERALRIDPRDIVARLNRGDLYRQRGRTDAAIAEYSAVIGFFPEEPDAFYRRAIVHHALQHPAEALADLTEALKLAPNHAKAHVERGSVYMDLQRSSEALEDFDAALRIDPTNPHAYNNRGMLYHRLGQDERALADLDAALRIEPNMAKALNNRGTVVETMGRYSEALNDFSAAIRIDSTYVSPYANRARILSSQGRHAEALGDLEIALRLQPALAGIYVTRGIVYSAMERLEEALADYDEALRLDPRLAEASFNRGLVYLKRRRHAEAMADFKRAVELRPDLEAAAAPLIEQCREPE